MEDLNSGAIPGTLGPFANSQLLISSGIPSFDELLGDGIPVGTITLIEEDSHAYYARILLKYFLAEGIVNKHDIFVATQEINPHSIIYQLPALIDSKSKHVDDDDEAEKEGEENFKPQRKMKIAFRYDNLPTKEKESAHKFGHYYDLSSVMSVDMINGCQIYYWDKNENKSSSLFSNSLYYNLLENIKKHIDEGNYHNSSESRRNILRIGIYGLGSPNWFPDSGAVPLEKEIVGDIERFLYCLRTLLKSSKVSAMVTLTSHLYDKCFIGVHSSDICVTLNELSGEQSKIVKDYHGFIHINKLAAINSFKSLHPGSSEYVFKLRRKKFIIEKFHLPPALESSSEKSPQLGCGSGQKNVLDF